MAISKIQYDNKVAINIDSTIPDINKCNASDLNEIKSVVNNNADEIPSIDNLVNVGSSVDTNYKTNILTTKNLFDKDTMVINGAIDANNSIISASNNFRSVYIKVQSNTTYTIQKILSNRFVIGFTSDNDTNMPKQLTNVWYNNNATTKTITSPNNVNYMFITISKISEDTTPIQDILDSIQVEQGNQATTYEAFIPNTINVNNEKYTDTINVGASINDKNRINVLYSKNLLNIQTIVKGRLDNGVIGYESNTTNLTLNENSFSFTTNANYRGATTDYIEVNATDYVISNSNGIFSSSLNIIVACYDTNKTFISNSQLTSYTANEIPFKVVNNTKYIRIYFYLSASGTTTIENPMLNEGSTALPYEPYLIPSINVDGEEIYSKPVVLYDGSSTTDVVLNDSITNYNYLDIIFEDDQDIQSSMKVKSTNNSAFILQMVKNSIANAVIFLVSTRYGMSGSNITLGQCRIFNLSTSGIVQQSTTNIFKITKVLGYK